MGHELAERNLVATLDGAVEKELTRIMTALGFVDIRITPREESRDFIREWLPESHLEDYVVSATIEAVKR